MADETLFAAALGIVLLGWLLLLAGVLVSGANVWCARLVDAGGLWVPVALCAGHALLLAISIGGGSGAEGSLFSLAGIVAKFADPDRLFLLYVEGMAFSLFIGRWIALDAAAAPRTLVVPILLVQSLLGPVGLVAWFALRGFGRRAKDQIGPDAAMPETASARASLPGHPRDDRSSTPF